MKEIALHILDIANNSVRAGATHIELSLVEEGETLTFTVKDNGCGMSADFLARVCDPFTTTRTTRKVGLGIPLLMLAARQTGGDVTISSHTGEGHGTELSATFYLHHIDCMPLGNMVDTVLTLIQGAPTVDWTYTHSKNGKCVSLSTAAIRQALGDDIPLDTPDVLLWIRSSLEEEYQLI